MDDFANLQEIVLGRASVPNGPGSFAERAQQRLLRALRGTTRPGAADLAALIRHMLRREEARQAGVPQEWWVPKCAEWPTAPQWRDAGVEVRSDLGNRFRIRAREWSPPWLPGALDLPPCRDAESETVLRNFKSVPGDPWLQVVNRSTYRCGAQREMVRGILTAPPGATLVCNLPTGAGKSLIAHLPALLRSRREGVTVVVVPTTALCMDQEAALAGVMPHPSAYHDGTLPDGSDRRREIGRRNVRWKPADRLHVS